MQKPSPEPQIGSRTISRVLYHSACGRHGDCHSSRSTVTCTSSNLPGSVDRADPLPYLVLLRTGLAELVTSPCRWWALTPPFHPYRPKAAVCFLWRSPRITPPGRYPASCPVKPGLSSPSVTPKRDGTRRQSIRLPKTQKLFGVVRHFISRLVGLFVEVLHPVIKR